MCGSHTSFLSNGVKNGSRTVRPATTVSIGSRQLNIAPYISIFPNLGSTGSIDKWRPVKGIYENSTQVSFKKKKGERYNRPQNKPSDLFLPKTVNSSLSSSAPITFRYSMAFCTYKKETDKCFCRAPEQLK